MTQNTPDTGVQFPLQADQIMHYLPHRPPMLMLDRALGIDEDGYLLAEKDVSEDAFFFQGHFEGHPIMPGVMIVEAIGQAGALLAAVMGSFDTQTHLLAFTGLERARFRQMVKPNETLCVYCKIVKSRRNLYKFEGRAEVDGRIVTDLQFSAALTPKET